MLNYLLLFFSIVLLLAGIRYLIVHAGVTKKKRVFISLITSLYSCYSLFFVFSDYISGNGFDNAVVYFFRDTFYAGGFREYGIFILIIIIIVAINFLVVNLILHKSEHLLGESAKQKLVFYLLVIFSFILNPTTLGLINHLSEKKPEIIGSATPGEDRYDINRFIAHAGGEIDGHTYTNSLEALNLNYKKGFRLFELDIHETSDHKYVAVHDWKQ